VILGARLRRLVLTAHVLTSVGWLGTVAAFLALAIVGMTSGDVELVRGIYLASEPLALFAIVPFAIGSLLTGLVQALGTHWGLVRHYWVIVKLVITVFAGLVLALYTQTVDHVSDVAASGADLATMRSASYALHSGGGTTLLLLATTLAVYKPRGLTRHGWRKQQQQQQERVSAAG
jgi:hypothetical protein